MLLAASTAAAADVDLRHAGRVLDANGDGSNATVNLTFRLFDGSGAGATQRYVHQESNVSLQDGYYAVTLQDVPSHLFSTYPELWVEVTVGNDVMDPRELLVSVPVAGLAHGVVLPTTGSTPCSTAGLLSYDAGVVLVCDGADWNRVDGKVGLVASGTAWSWADGTYARSCLEYRTPPDTDHLYEGEGDGVYTIDTDGAGARDPFDVWCDMTIDGGGWTLIMAITENAAPTSVGNAVLIAPDSATSRVNTDMQLPNVSQVLTVQDVNDVGFETAYDKAEKWTGVAGISISWAQILAALNSNGGSTWADNGYSTGSDDGWQFAVTRVSTTGCLQTPLRGTYGDGNYGGFNGAGYAPAGGLYIHWGQETWVAGVYGNNPDWVVCGSSERDNNVDFFKGTYLC